MHSKKVLSDSKANKQASNLKVLVALKEKNKIVFQFPISIMKLNFLVFIELSK
jgi:hypothetical protein